jgi:hypothetical protein
MTDKSLKVYIGDDRLPVQDLTDYVDWPDSRFIGQAYNGESSVSSVVFRDENARFGPWVDSPVTIAVRNEVEVLHGSNFLYRGRWIGRTWERGVQKAYQAREVTAEAEDVNVELRGLIVDGWERPAETDRARVLALREDYLDGSVRPGSNLSTTYVSSSNTFTLPAKTYERTDPLGVLQDVAFQTHKQFFVTIDKELFYDGWDSSAYACSFRITDDEAELRTSPTTTLGIVPDSGPLFAINGQRFIDGVRLYYGAGPTDYVDVTHPGLSSAKAHWRETVYAPESIKTATEAANLAETILQERSQDGRTFTLSVCHASGGPLTDAQVGSIKPGMLISIKARVLPFFLANGQPNYAYVTTRIVTLQWHMPLPGQYFATLKLEKPERTFGVGVPPGPTPAGSNPAELVDCDFSNAGSDIALNFEAGLTDSMLVAVGFGFDDLTGRTPSTPAVYTPSVGAPQNMTEIPGSLQLNAGLTHGVRMYYLLNPTASPAGSGTGHIFIPKVDFPTEGTWGGWWLFRNVYQSAPLGTAATNSGSGTSSSLTIPGSGVFVNAVGIAGALGIGAPTVAAGQTLCDTHFLGTVGAGNGHGDSTPSWTFPSASWQAVGVAVNGTGSATEPIGDGGDPGTDTGQYANPDHVHAHGTHTADYHTNYVQESILTTAGDVPYATGASTWTRLAIGSSNFHLRSDGTKPVWSPESAGGGMTNPMTTAGDIIKGGAAGTPERLAIGASNFHLRSDGTAPVWSPESSALTNPMDAVGDLIRGGTAGAPTKLALGASNFILKSSGTLPEWSNTARLSYLDVDEHTGGNPPSPVAGTIRIYGSNSKGYYENSGGTVVELGGAGGGASLTVEDEGSALSTAATTLDFVGAGVTASGTGAEKTITIPGASSSSPFGIDNETLDATTGDHFDGTSLDAKWTRHNIGANTELFENSHLRVDIQSGTADQHYRQTIVSNDEIDLVMDLSRYDAPATDIMTGPFLADASGTGLAIGFRSTDVLEMSGLSSWVATSSPVTIAVSGGTDDLTRLGKKHWLHLTKRGGRYFMRYSLDGNTWSRWSLLRTDSLAPVRAGFGRYFGNGASVASGLAVGRFDLKRYSRSANRVITPSSGTATYTASSAVGGWEAQYAANGSYTNGAGNAWAANGTGDAPTYWQVAWSVAQSINRVDLFCRDSLGHGYLEFSDGSKVGIPQAMTDLVAMPISFATKSTTLLKVVSTGDKAGNPGLTEVEAYLATLA